jgi:hypothetical protein
MYAFITPKWGAAPNQPIVSIFSKFSSLADVINCAKFQNLTMHKLKLNASVYFFFAM